MKKHDIDDKIKDLVSVWNLLEVYKPYVKKIPELSEKIWNSIKMTAA